MDRQEIKEKWNTLPPLARDILEPLIAVILILAFLKIVLGSHLLVPIVVVISGSMLHVEGDNGWNTWLKYNNITDEQIADFPLRDGFARGDLIVTMRPTVKLGDVVIYERDQAHNHLRGEPIIHRIVGVATIEGNAIEVEGTLDCLSKDVLLTYASKNNIKNSDPGKIKLYITKGDNNDRSDQCGGIAYPITEDRLLAKTFLKIPKVGYVKLYMVDTIQKIREIL